MSTNFNKLINSASITAAAVLAGLGISNVAHADEFGTPYPPELMARYDLIPQGLSAELIAKRWEVSRAEQDELGLRSHQLAARAWKRSEIARSQTAAAATRPSARAAASRSANISSMSAPCRTRRRRGARGRSTR